MKEAITELKENLKNIAQKYNEGNLEKIKYFRDVISLGSCLSDFLSEAGYDRSRDNIDNLEKNLKKNLIHAKETLSNISKHPNAAYRAGIRKCAENLHAFLNEYKIGYISDFRCSHGAIIVTLGCRIAMSSVAKHTGKRISEKYEFDKQMKRLVSAGVDIYETGVGSEYRILATEKSMSAIQKILPQFCNVKFEVEKRNVIASSKCFLSKIIITFKTDSLIQYQPSERRDLFCFGTGNNLNPDEMDFLVILLKDMYGNLSSIENDKKLIPVCGYLLEQFYMNLADIFFVETDYTRMLHSTSANIKKIQEETSSIQQSLSLYADGSLIRETMLERKEFLDKTISSTINFSVCDYYVDDYEREYVSLIYLSSPYFIYAEENDEIGAIDTKVVKSIFDTIGQSLEDSDLYVIHSEKNIKFIEEALLVICPDMEIQEIVTEKRNGSFVIHKIKLISR